MLTVLGCLKFAYGGSTGVNGCFCCQITCIVCEWYNTSSDVDSGVKSDNRKVAIHNQTI